MKFIGRLHSMTANCLLTLHYLILKTKNKYKSIYKMKQIALNIIKTAFAGKKEQ